MNPDNVQEYRVTTNNATPEEGRNSGASVSIATRSGTNEYHGTLPRQACAGQYEFRAEPRHNLFRSPSYWNMDLGIQKVFALMERVRLQFRAEFFNALNHANFDNPTGATDGSNQITSSIFGRTCCEAVAPSSTQNIIQTGEAARVIQFGLKLQF